MKIEVFPNRAEMGPAAAAEGAKTIRMALATADEVAIIVATGTSQFEVLSALAAEPGIDWGRVTVFHLDEYVGLPETHGASFRKYLRERFIDQLPSPPKAFHAIDAETDPEGECRRLGELICRWEISVAFVGIGENGHLAFNDPPADFTTEHPYIVVALDNACRNQQLGEGWFPTFEDVPSRAISMSIRQIMKSRHIVCSAPDERKAVPVKSTVEGTVSPNVPASILQKHSNTTLYLDEASASLLRS